MFRFANTAGTFIAVFIASFIVALTLAGCNANSDAVKVLETDNTSLRATVDSYQSMGPTMTAQASILGDKLTSAQATITAISATNAALMSQMNANVNQSTTIIVTPGVAQPGPQAGTPVAGNGGAGGAAASADSGFAFASVVTAKAKGNDGCSSGESSVFSPTDPMIWVIADVRNFKRGTVFTANWSNSADFSHQNTWTVPNDGAQICVHFYIEPKTLSLKAGSYTVTLSTPALSSQPVPFTIQDAAAPQATTSTGK